MARPRKCRRVCDFPRTVTFLPENPKDGAPEIVLTVDEYECVRLIDKEGLSQEQCGALMQVARATVQQIYASAREKLASMLVDGLALRIEGGDYRLCDGEEAYCGCGGCRRRLRGQMENAKEERNMRIAIPLDENREDVCIVLARAPYFLFRDESGETIVENPAAQAQGGAGVQAAQFLVDSGVTELITVRCGQNAADVFAAAGIKLYKSVHKTAAEELAALAKGELEPLTRFHGGFHGGQ